MGPATETCTITLTPIMPNGVPEVQEVKQCTYTLDGSGGNTGGSNGGGSSGGINGTSGWSACSTLSTPPATPSTTTFVTTSSQTTSSTSSSSSSISTTSFVPNPAAIVNVSIPICLPGWPMRTEFFVFLLI